MNVRSVFCSTVCRFGSKMAEIYFSLHPTSLHSLIHIHKKSLHLCETTQASSTICRGPQRTRCSFHPEATEKSLFGTLLRNKRSGPLSVAGKLRIFCRHRPWNSHCVLAEERHLPLVQREVPDKDQRE